MNPVTVIKGLRSKLTGGIVNLTKYHPEPTIRLERIYKFIRDYAARSTGSITQIWLKLTIPSSSMIHTPPITKLAIITQPTVF